MFVVFYWVSFRCSSFIFKVWRLCMPCYIVMISFSMAILSIIFLFFSPVWYTLLLVWLHTWSNCSDRSSTRRWRLPALSVFGSWLGGFYGRYVSFHAMPTLHGENYTSLLYSMWYDREGGILLGYGAPRNLLLLRSIFYCSSLMSWLWARFVVFSMLARRIPWACLY